MGFRRRRDRGREFQAERDTAAEAPREAFAGGPHGATYGDKFASV